MLRIAVLIKQVPLSTAFELLPEGRMRREGLPLEMNAYCRRAVSAGVALAREHGGTCTVITMGPPAAEDILREAVAWGADRGVLVTDRQLAGSDTLVTSRALVATLQQVPFDLIVVGRNSIDADTGQVGPQVAAMLGLPFLSAARELTVTASAGGGHELRARLELDDGSAEGVVQLPAVVACAERLCDPAKVPPPRRALVDASLIATLTANDLGPGPWGEAGSPTRVGSSRSTVTERRQHVLSGTVAQQVADAIAIATDLGAFADAREATTRPTPAGRGLGSRPLAVIAEPGRSVETREMLGAAAELAVTLGRHVCAVDFGASSAAELSTWGADEVVHMSGVAVPEDTAAALDHWVVATNPAAVFASSTLWGRELLSRLAVRRNAGLIGDAVDLSIENGRLVGWKPAFGDALVAAITSASPTTLVTMRPGALPLLGTRAASDVPTTTLDVPATSRVRLGPVERDDDLDELARARRVICLGAAIEPDRYAVVRDWAAGIGAELGATRRVTDVGWLPRSRQIGLTGRIVAPDLFVSLASRGSLNHTVGFRRAQAVLAVNNDPRALVFEHADAGIVGDWQEVGRELFPALAEAVRAGS